MAFNKNKYKRVTFSMPINEYKALLWWIKEEKMTATVPALCKGYVEGCMEDVVDWYNDRNKK